MSGHSKWSTIKRQKQATDQVRGQAFTKLANAITIAVKEGGSGDPEANFRLRLAIDKAKSFNVPKENIERAIERALGKGSSGILEEVLYEGFGPQGIALLAEGVTDNKQRTAAAVKNIFGTHGGTLSGVGSVAYLFERVGAIHLEKKTEVGDVLSWVIEAGGDDLEENEDRYIVFTKPQALVSVRQAIGTRPVTISESELTYRPKTSIVVQERENAQKLIRLLHALDDLEDIHKVHTNADIPEEYLT